MLSTGAGGKPLETAMPTTVVVSYAALGTFQVLYVAPRPMKVNKIVVRVGVIGSDGGAVTGVVNKMADGKAYNDASKKIQHTGSINFKGTADTQQILGLTTTPGDNEMAAGDGLYLVPTGVTTAAIGVIVIELIPLA